MRVVGRVEFGRRRLVNILGLLEWDYSIIYMNTLKPKKVEMTLLDSVCMYTRHMPPTSYNSFPRRTVGGKGKVGLESLLRNSR